MRRFSQHTDETRGFYTYQTEETRTLPYYCARPDRRHGTGAAGLTHEELCSESPARPNWTVDPGTLPTPSRSAHRKGD
ncbi:protein of unknown function [Paraburkholderia kururiensis]